jgi:precorrin-3B synthase
MNMSSPSRTPAAPPARKGWCPSLVQPMASGDGWIARVKPSAAELTAEDVDAICLGALQFGNGLIDVTRRGNLQVRGLTEHSSAQLADALLARGLGNPDPAVERIRNVMTAPLAAWDPTAAFDAARIALRIEALLGISPSLQALPAKFGFAIDGGGLLRLGDHAADICVRVVDGRPALDLAGGPVGALSRPKQAATDAVALAEAFVELTQGRAEPPRRMAHLIAEVGAEEIVARAGLTPIALPPAEPVALRVGYTRLPQEERGAVVAALPFGQIEAEKLRRIAMAGLRYGDGRIRITPWRALAIAEVKAGEAAHLMAALEEAGAILDTASPLLNVIACSGAPACASAHAPTRDDALALARAGAADTVKLHVSGCAKRCAHPDTGMLTLVAGEDGYTLVRPSGATDANAAGLSLAQAIALLGGKGGDRPG